MREQSPKVEKNKKMSPEKTAELGNNFAMREADSDMTPKRKGAFLLSTFLALGLSLGMMAGEAKAQQGSGWGKFGRELAGEVFSRGTFEADSSMDRTQNAKMDKLENDYVAALGKFERMENRLGSDYENIKRGLQKKGDKEGLQNLESEYATEKAKIAQAKIELRQNYEKEKMRIKAGQQIRRGIVQGIRGW